MRSVLDGVKWFYNLLSASPKQPQPPIYERGTFCPEVHFVRWYILSVVHFVTFPVCVLHSYFTYCLNLQRYLQQKIQLQFATFFCVHKVYAETHALQLNFSVFWTQNSQRYAAFALLFAPYLLQHIINRIQITFYTDNIRPGGSGVSLR